MSLINGKSAFLVVRENRRLNPKTFLDPTHEAKPTKNYNNYNKAPPGTISYSLKKNFYTKLKIH